MSQTIFVESIMLVLSSRGTNVSAEPIFLILFEVADVRVTIWPLAFSEPVKSIMFPLSYIRLLVGLDKFTSAMSCIIAPRALVVIFVIIEESAIPVHNGLINI